MNEKEIVQDTQNQIKDLCSLLQSLHPVETLKMAYLEFVVQHSEIETESEIRTEAVQSRFLVEYLQSIFISIDLKEKLRPPIDEKEWKQIKEKAKNIYDNCTLFPLINPDNNFISQEDKALSHKVFISWIQIRGNRPIVHEYEHLNSLLIPHNEILKELYKITVQDILEGVKKINHLGSFALEVLRESYEAKQEFQRFCNDVKKTYTSNEKIKKLLKNKIIELQLEEKVYKENFDIQKITGWPKDFIQKFSASTGSHKNFIENREYYGTPLQLLPVVRKPFLKYNSRFHLFCPYIFNDHFYRNIQYTVLQDQPDYSETWNKKQKTVSEQIPFDILKKNYWSS